MDEVLNENQRSVVDELRKDAMALSGQSGGKSFLFRDKLQLESIDDNEGVERSKRKRTVSDEFKHFGANDDNSKVFRRFDPELRTPDMQH